MKIEFSPKAQASEMKVAWNEAWKFVPKTSRRVLKRYVQKHFRNGILKITLLRQRHDIDAWDTFPFAYKKHYTDASISKRFWDSTTDKTELMLSLMAFLVMCGTGGVEAFNISATEYADWIFDDDKTSEISTCDTEILVRHWRGDTCRVTANADKLLKSVTRDLEELQAVFTEVV